MKYHSLYAAFEIHPSRKGASTHITQMVDVLSKSSSPTLVCAIKGEEIQSNSQIIHYELFDQQVAHYLDRGRTYSGWLRNVLNSCGSFEIAQFRDIWSGLPILESGKSWMNIFEANGFPSIELFYRYPDISMGTIKKIKMLELYCLTASDLIICPSTTIKNYIISLGIPDSKIEVITNGATIPSGTRTLKDNSENYITYFGAMQYWQGIDTLIKAFNTLKDIKFLKLIICSSQREKFSKPYKKIIEDFGMEARVIWKYMLDENQLNEVIGNSLFTVAPLKETARNIVQGCSPLKIFESMAQGVPVLASDIPVVREIISNGIDGQLVRPDRPSELSRMMRMLIDFPDYTSHLGTNAVETVKNKFLWSDIKDKLSGIYLRNKAFAA